MTESRRIFAELERFHGLRTRFGARPTPEQFDEADKSGREKIKRQQLGHQLIDRILSQIAENGHHDPRDEREVNNILREMAILPLAVVGQKFKVGRKPGSVGPIRKAVARFLKNDPGLKPRALWVMLKGVPPRGWTFCENRQGKYIEGPRARNVSYHHFQNIAKEERDKLT